MMASKKTDFLFDDMTQYWQDKIDDIKKSLVKALPNSAGGGTYQSISLNDLSTNKKYHIQIVMPDYYAYIDEGVKGTSGSKRNTGRFSFKSSNNMINVGAVKQWMINRRIVGTKYHQIKKIKNKQLKKKSIEKHLTSIAIAIAKSIHQEGLEQTNFYSDNVNVKTIKEFERLAADLAKQGLLVTITKNMGKRDNIAFA